MICQPCIDAPRGECLPVCKNTLKETKTWCDCQHAAGPVMDQNQCLHIHWTDDNGACPTCGMTWKMYYDRISKTAIQEAMEGAANDG